jgi:LacI family transcriptional regulator
MPTQLTAIVSLPFDAEYFRQVVMGMRDAQAALPEVHLRIRRWEGCAVLARQIEETERTGWRVEGVIVGIGSTDDLTAIRRFWQRPLVNLSGRASLPGVPSVLPDSVAIGRLACEHLLERGFRRLGFVGRNALHYSVERQRGFTAAAKEAGIEVQAHEWSGPEALQTWLRALPRPIGILGCQDLMAFQVLDTAVRLGLEVPEEVAVLGVDNSAISCELAQVPLSSVDMDGAAIGQEAVKLVARLRRGEPWPPGPLLVPPARVVVRRSTSAWAVRPPELAQALAYIEAHACDPISVGQVVEAVPIARRTLEREMSRQIGRSPHQQIRHTQLQRARQLLDETNLKIRLVGAQCGFRNAKHFATAFRKAFGLGPQRYRLEAQP